MTAEREERLYLLLDRVNNQYRQCHSKVNWNRRIEYGKRIYKLLGLEFYYDKGFKKVNYEIIS